MKYQTEIGEQYNQWTVIGPATAAPVKVPCRCSCGTEKMVGLYNLARGQSKGCGCANKGPLKHGLSDRQEYQIWKAMKARCSNPNHKNYPGYGGRGISVCAEWADDFPQFLADMGPRPSLRHSVDRIDHNGPYSATNCRWATQVEQTNNTRRSVRVKFHGRKRTVAEMAEETGIGASTIYKRLKAGWPEERMLAPVTQQ